MTAINSKLAVPAFTGKGSKARANAFAGISAIAFAEDVGRLASIANMRVVLGNAPSEAEVSAAKVRYVIGRVASRLPASKVPLVSTQEQRLARAEDLVCFFAAPPKEGTQPRKLRAGQKGRRTTQEQKLVRAAEESASTFFAELGLTNAATNAARASVKVAKKEANAPSMAGTGKGKKGGKAGAPASAPMIALKPAPIDAKAYVQHLQTTLSQLVAFDDANAKVRPVTHGAVAEALRGLRTMANKAASEFALREAAEVKKPAKK